MERSDEIRNLLFDLTDAMATGDTGALATLSGSDDLLAIGMDPAAP